MKKNTYVINHAKKTITLTKKYAKLANTPGTNEFRELADVYKVYSNYTIVMRTVTPNEDKKKHTGLTIARMEYHIKNIAKDDVALAQFEEVQKYYKGMSGYYGKVRSWFLEKYPNYNIVDFEALVSVQKESDTSAEETNDSKAG